MTVAYIVPAVLLAVVLSVSGYGKLTRLPAIGVVLYFVGAVVAHVVHRDHPGLKNPAPPLVAAVATVVGGLSL